MLTDGRDQGESSVEPNGLAARHVASLRRIWRRIDRNGGLDRIIDLLGSVVLLIFLAPLIAVVAIAQWKSAGRPILFRQKRAGRDGAPFTILKFRTMDMGDASCCGDPDRCRGLQMARGSTVTRTSAMVRRTGLDELPQLINVLRGEMSFVGPRPLLLRYLPRYTDQQRRRGEVRPGITGWAQVNGRTDLSWEQRLALDVWYVDNRSISLDFKIALRTIEAIVRGSGYSQVGDDTGPEFLGRGVEPGICPALELPMSRVGPDREAA